MPDGDQNIPRASGTPVKLHAQWMNDTTNATTAYLRQRASQSAPPLSFKTLPGKILVRNDSDDDVDQYAILGIAQSSSDDDDDDDDDGDGDGGGDDDGSDDSGGVIVGPDDNLVEFQTNPCFSGHTPSASSDTGLFVIALQAIKSGSIGPACIFGVCPVQVNFNSADDQYADVTDGDTTQLTSGSSGAAQILCNPSGDTGKQWALVRLGAPGGTTRFLLNGSTSVSTNIWKYTGKIGTYSVSGSSAPTFTTTGDNVTLYNGMEYGNSGTGIQGNGINMSDVPSGMSMQPIGNAVVDAEQIGVDDSGTPIYEFSKPNQFGGSCSSGGSGS